MPTRIESANVARQRGAGIVETMIGILIGLLVILVIYSLVSAAENYRRTTTGISDAQITGLLSQFIMGRDLGNGGNGTMISAPDLVKCTKDEAGNPTSLMRPIPVLVTDSGSGSVSDTFVAMNSAASRVVWPVEFTSDSLPGTDFVVQTPNGFTTPAPSVATPYWVIAIANDASGKCGMYQISGATAADAQGRVTLTHVQASTIAYTAGAPAKLVNLGPQGLATRIQYESWNTALGEVCGLTASATRPCQLTSLDLMTAGATRNPVSSNVVLMKIQYGIDTTATPDGTIDCWTAAVDGSATCPGNYSPATLALAPLDQIERIVAVRVAVVVRSDEPEPKDDSLLAANRPAVVLFNCSLDTDAGCPGRITLPAGNPGSKNIIQDHWRYRVYETVVALRNPLYIETMQ